MGHLLIKDTYLALGNKIDGLPFRISKNKELLAILKAPYTSEEAELVIKMPYGLSTFIHQCLEQGTMKKGAKRQGKRTPYGWLF